MVTIKSFQLISKSSPALDGERLQHSSLLDWFMSCASADYDSKKPFVDVVWPASSGKIGQLKKGLKPTRIEPFSLYSIFVKEGSTSTNALRATLTGGMESGYNGMAHAVSSDARGIFQGRPAYGWPSVLSNNSADHKPMISKMIKEYDLKDGGQGFDSIYAKHFTPLYSSWYSKAESVVRFSDSSDDALKNQYVIKNTQTGETVTSFAWAALRNLYATISLTEDHNFDIVINIPLEMNIAVVSGKSLSHYETRARAKWEPVEATFTKNQEYVFIPTKPLTSVSGKASSQRVATVKTAANSQSSKDAPSVKQTQASAKAASFKRGPKAGTYKLSQ